MVHRRDLVDHFDWLSGSRYFEDVLDEALVAIALTAHGHGSEPVSYGAAWMMADDVVEVLRLGCFLERARDEHAAVWGPPECAHSPAGA